ncbi:hypothetical protein [Parabacteroides segnis]|nr:hypothetical protein [Parabacteroides segnis]
MMNIQDYKSYQRGIIFAGAPHCEKKLTEEECSLLLKHYNGWFIRNLYDFDCKEKTSFWFVINDRPLTISDLPTKTRNQVRRALNTLDIKKVSSETMLDKNNGGYDVYFQSFSRYKDVTSKPVTKEIWSQWIKSRSDVEYWAAYNIETGKMIAYVDVLIQNGIAKYTAMKGIPAFLNKNYPFYGLLFIMQEYYVEKQRLRFVTDGARSVTEHSNIQSFLDKFRFRRAYCRIQIKYVWWVKILISFLYPVRNIIPIKKIKYLLRFEAMQRGQY